MAVEQLGFWNFLALAIHAKTSFFKNTFTLNLYENVRFFGKTLNFQARCGRFSHEPNIFFNAQTA
jgi:hypothetical protein